MKEKKLLNKKETFAQSKGRLPDFIIVGAMKAGTTTLHHILNQHKCIFIPNRELLFFDIDDIEQNFDFFVETSQTWSIFDFEKNFDEYLRWYKSFFKDAREGQLIGEDSTTYMASQKTPSRIADLFPDVKLIFMLRDPVFRTYSHYWNMVRTGQAIYDFEKTMQYMPGTLLQRSLYKTHIERYKRYFHDKNMKFIIFEEFVEDIQRTINEVCKFLGLDSSIDVSKINTHKNPAVVPKNIRLQVVYNRILRSRNLTTKKFGSHLPHTSFNKPNKVFEIFDTVFKRVNITRKRKYPPMRTSTKQFLQKLFSKENRGLSNLIRKDVQEYWIYMKD